MNFSTPAYYTPGNIPPTCEGWYFAWQGIQGTYLHWPTDDWANVTYYVELPPFIQVVLQQAAKLESFPIGNVN